MMLFEIGEKYPNYAANLDEDANILNAEVYVSADHEIVKVGNVDNFLLDEHDRICYLVVQTNPSLRGKKILLPVGCCYDDTDSNRIYIRNLSEEQIEQLPEYTQASMVDGRYEAQVRSIYLTSAENEMLVEGAQVNEKSSQDPLASSAGFRNTPYLSPQAIPNSTEKANDHRRLKLYEERLVASKRRIKTGEVTITKRIETEPASVSVPIQKEKIIIEIESIRGTTQVNLPDGQLSTGETAHVDRFEECLDIRKEPVAWQDVTIRKEIVQDVVEVQETVRRETLEIQQSGSFEVHERSAD
jgi:uncharacterized protein (TIGR02271 family)